MPLTELSTLIEHDLIGATRALNLAETHPDQSGKICFAERARLRLAAAEQETLRYGLNDFQPRIEQLKHRLHDLETRPSIPVAG